jgi:hypothetical protein
MAQSLQRSVGGESGRGRILLHAAPGAVLMSLSTIVVAINASSGVDQLTKGYRKWRTQGETH